MTRVNPLYILLLALTILIISFVLVNKEQKALQISAKNFYEQKVLAKEYQLLKSNYKSNRDLKSHLETLLSEARFKKDKFKVQKLKKQWKIKLSSQNSLDLEYFLNRLLKQRFSIKKIEIKKHSIYVEVRI